MTETVRIPEKVYIGFQGRRSVDEVPLGFMIPYTDDTAGKNRCSTVDQWARGYGRDKTFNSVIIDNKPMHGFRLGRAIRRSGYRGSGASYVRIEDPRGFELEITIENLVAVMEDSAVEQCVFLQELVWARLPGGNRNILVATNSQLFKDSQVMASAVAAALDPKDINIGDLVTLASGETGEYMGNMYSIGSYDGKFSSGKKPVLKIVNQLGVIDYKGFTNFKVVAVVTQTSEPKTLIQSEIEIGTLVNSDPFCCSSTGSNTVIGWVAGKGKSVCSNSIDRHLSFDEFYELWNKSPTSYKYVRGTTKVRALINGISERMVFGGFQLNVDSDDIKKSSIILTNEYGYGHRQTATIPVTDIEQILQEGFIISTPNITFITH